MDKSKKINFNGGYVELFVPQPVEADAPERLQ